jgi:hypothetical protein
MGKDYLFAYDPEREQITILGIVYSLDFFRQFAADQLPKEIVILQNENGIITVTEPKNGAKPMRNSKYFFELGDTVWIECSGEKGMIVARSESLESDNQYFVRYKASDGRAVEGWWSERALLSTPGGGEGGVKRNAGWPPEGETPK